MVSRTGRTPRGEAKDPKDGTRKMVTEPAGPRGARRSKGKTPRRPSGARRAQHGPRSKASLRGGRGNGAPENARKMGPERW